MIIFGKMHDGLKHVDVKNNIKADESESTIYFDDVQIFTLDDGIITFWFFIKGQKVGRVVMPFDNIMFVLADDIEEKIERALKRWA